MTALSGEEIALPMVHAGITCRVHSPKYLGPAKANLQWYQDGTSAMFTGNRLQMTPHVLHGRFAMHILDASAMHILRRGPEGLTVRVLLYVVLSNHAGWHSNVSWDWDWHFGRVKCVRSWDDVQQRLALRCCAVASLLINLTAKKKCLLNGGYGKLS
jgi:hypothetical protein